MKFIKKIRNLQKKRAIFAIIAVIGFIGMLGSAGAMDCGTDFLSVCMTLTLFVGIFVIGFIGMKHYDDAVIAMRKQLVNAKRRALANDKLMHKTSGKKAVGSAFCDIA